PRRFRAPDPQWWRKRRATAQPSENPTSETIHEARANCSRARFEGVSRSRVTSTLFLSSSTVWCSSLRCSNARFSRLSKGGVLIDDSSLRFAARGCQPSILPKYVVELVLACEVRALP